METTIKINTDLMTPEFIEEIKSLFPYKTAEITFRPTDETEYKSSNPLSNKFLQDKSTVYEANNEIFTVKMSEVEYKAYLLYLESIKAMLNVGKKVSRNSSIFKYLANAENIKEIEAGLEDIKAGRITYIDPENIWESIK